MNNWHKLTLVIPGIFAGFLLFVFFALPAPAHAEEPCLRGGDGTCVELLHEAPDVSTSGATIPSKSITGPSTATNFFTLADGSMVAMLAKAKTSFGNGGVTNLNRYEIELYYSRDGGVTWTQPPVANKGQWYVDEHRDGSISQGTFAQDGGVGFLGFDVSTVYDSSAKKTYIVLAHTIACGSSNYINPINPEPPKQYPSITTFKEYDTACDSLTSTHNVSGSVYIDTIVYDSTDYSFDEIGQTRAFTRSAAMISSQGVFACNTGICYGGGLGADHPSVAATLVNSNLRIWTSYSAFRGGHCPGGGDGYTWNRCPDQNIKDWNKPGDGYWGTPASGEGTAGVRNVKKFWVRQLQIDKSTGQLSAISTDPRDDNYDMGERIPSSGSGTSNSANYFVSKIVILRGNFPLVLYSYSDPNSPTHKNFLQWRYWNGTKWSDAKKVEGDDINNIIKNNYLGILHIVGSVPSSLNTWEKIPSIAAVGSPRDSSVMAQVVAYAKTTNDKNDKYVPVYLKFYMNDNQSISNPEALVLANDTGTNLDSLGVAATTGSPMYVNPDLGGPSIGWGHSFIYVAVPQSLNGDPKKSSVVYTRIEPPTDGDGSLSSSWFADRDTNENPDAPIYFQVTNPSPSPGASEGFAQPKITNYPPQYIPTGEKARPEALSNIFSLQMIFARAHDNSSPCSSTNWCSANFSGNYNTNGIRGWAWAESVGWLSLSCENLSTCFSKNYDSSGNAWSTKEGGLYYGVRAVTNPAFPSRTLIGKAWSERVGYVSFDRETSVNKNNPCGNPPVATSSPYYITNSPTARECALLGNDITDDPSSPITLVDENGDAIPSSDFKTSRGSLRIDSEVIFYTGIDASGTLKGVRRETTSTPLANKIYVSKARSHTAGTPVFWINGNEVTTDANGTYDIYRGINSFDPTSYQLDGYARAESWANYQESYCSSGIGAGQAPPCDKEWGWIKLSGEWSTVHWGSFKTISSKGNPSCGSNTMYSTSVDGYPVPAPGKTEKLYVSGQCISPPCHPNYLWDYTSIDPAEKSFTLVKSLPSGGFAGQCPPNSTSIVWTATLQQSISAADTTLRLSSVAGLLPSGKLIIRQDTNGNNKIDTNDQIPEIIEYSGVDESTNQLESVTRGVDGTSAGSWGTSAFVEQVNETGNYNTFVIPVGHMQPEQTLGGFGWSAPNTETLSPDPSVSRYKDNIAGFGWINFQPSKFDQIYPYIRALFGSLYVGGDVDIVGPEYNLINPTQYSATYLIQTNGTITQNIDEPQGASSGQLQQCLGGCSDQTCIDECTNAYGPSDAPDFDFTQGSSSVLGKVPDLDAISTLVSQCQRWDPAANGGLGDYIDAPCSTNPGDPKESKQARELTSGFADLATTGLNKFGQQVVLCRADPTVTDPSGLDVFTTSTGRYYENNPPECQWSKSHGFIATLTEDVGTSADHICVSSHGSIPDSGQIAFGNDDTHMNNNVSYTANDSSSCATGTRLDISTNPLYPTDKGNTVSEIVQAFFYKVRHGHTGRPTIYVIPDNYGNASLGWFGISGMGLQFNNGDGYYDWDMDGDGLANDLLPQGKKESGAISFVIPGSLIFMDSQMRYCPQGMNLFPCTAAEDLPYNAETNNDSNLKVTDTSQIASVAWFIDGSTTNLVLTEGGGVVYPELKMYRVGAFVVLGNDKTEFWKPNGKAGTYFSIYLTGEQAQLNVYGLVIARNFFLTGQYYVQDKKGHVIEPSENFIYDGRVVVNPPPGLEDFASGLPTIRQAIP